MATTSQPQDSIVETTNHDYSLPLSNPPAPDSLEQYNGLPTSNQSQIGKEI